MKKTTARKYSCTGVIIGKDLSKNHTTMFGRSEDLEVNHNKIYELHPSGTYQKGFVIKDESIAEHQGYEYTMPFDSYAYSSIQDTTPEYGIFDEAGFNEHGLMVDMTVSASCNHATAIIDPYVDGSNPSTLAGINEAIMATVVLTSCKTAKEAIDLLCKEINLHGASEGNTLVVADRDELYYMEIYTGHQYAVLKYPDDCFSVFPNTYFLNEVCMNDLIEKEDYLQSKDGNWILSKEILRVAKDAHTLVFDPNTNKMNLSLSYRPFKMKDGVKSRYQSGVSYLLKQNDYANLDDSCPFLLKSPYEYDVQDVFALLRNRFEHLPMTASDLKGKRYPIGNREALEAHVFEVSKDNEKETPGVLYVALGSPITSVFVPYFPNQTSVIEPARNPSNTYTKDSVYWLNMAMLHMVETSRVPMMKLVEETLFDLQKENIVSPLVKDRLTSTKTNQMLARNSYHKQLELYEKLQAYYHNHLSSHNLKSDYSYGSKDKKFAGSYLLQKANSYDSHLHFELQQLKDGYLVEIKDPFGNLVEEFNHPVTICFPKKSLYHPYIKQHGEKVTLKPHENMYQITTTKPTVLIYEGAKNFPYLIGAGAIVAGYFLNKKKK